MAPPWVSPPEPAAQQALDATYLSAGILSSEVAGHLPRRWPTAVDFARQMAKITAGLGYAGDVKANIEAASIRRAHQLINGACASAFLTDQALDLDEMISVPTVIEPKSLGSGDEQSLMIALLLNAMTEYYKANRRSSSTLQHVTVVEEAHRLLARPREPVILPRRKPMGGPPRSSPTRWPRTASTARG